MHKNSQIGVRLVIGAAILLATSVGAAQKVKSSLTSTGVLPAAKGKSQLVVKSASDGRFEVKVQKLAQRAAYDVLVGGVKVGSIHTRGGGNGALKFRSVPKGAELPLGFDPRGDNVEVRDADGDDVLTGDVADDGGNPTDVTCCVPHSEGAECEDRTADECTAQGGTVSTATSCLPNPCGDSTAGAFVACCEPEDDGTAECELRTDTACLAHGGVVGTATTCDPNPCTATFPPTDIQCCLPDDNGTECEDRTPEACVAQGGVDMGAGSCNPNPCSGGSGGDDNGGSGGDDNSGHGSSNRGGGHDD